MKKPLLGILLAGGTLASLSSIASAEVTAPVGYVKLTFNSTADTPFSLPLNRAKAYTGQASAIAGNVLSVSSNDFTADQYVYVNGSQDEKYYVLFTTGTLEGRAFNITDNSVNGITVETEVEEAGQAAPTLQSLGALANDRFEIRPHWTLATAFPTTSSFPKSTNANSPAAYIMERPLHQLGTTTSASGTNTPLDKLYFYFDSSNDSLDGWYLVGDNTFTKQDDKIIERGLFYVGRNQTNTTVDINVSGDVPLVDKSNRLRQNLVTQDNYIALGFPVEVSLGASGLINSGFKKTTDANSLNGDLLLAYDDVTTTYNPNANKIYFYFDSTNDAVDGWYLVGDNTFTKQDTVRVFKPGKGYIVRKAPDTTDKFEKWSTDLPYNPFAE